MATAGSVRGARNDGAVRNWQCARFDHEHPAKHGRGLFFGTQRTQRGAKYAKEINSEGMDSDYFELLFLRPLRPLRPLRTLRPLRPPSGFDQGAVHMVP